MKQAHRSLRRSIPSLQSLSLFEASARHLNFSKAAEEVGITQPAVSHGIRQLEQVLGQPLFVRAHRALTLTTQGQRLFASVSQGLAGIAETIDDIVDAARQQTVVVCASTALATEWLLPRLPGLREKHPNLIVDVRCMDRDPDLAGEGIDLHVRLGDGRWPDCDATRLWPETIAAVCSPAYRDANGEIGDAPSQVFIHYLDPFRFRIGWAEWFRALGATAPALPVSLRVNDALLAQRAAERGEGIALGWRPVIDEALAEGRLVLACSRPVGTGRDFYAVTAPASRRRRHVTAFKDWLGNEAT